MKPYPDITFTHAPSMWDHLITSHYSPKIYKFPTDVGTFPCGRCDVCILISNSREVNLPNGLTYIIRPTVTCKTGRIVYLATCRCGCYYVGKTERPFCKRIWDHVKPLYKWLTTTAINRHIGSQHDFDPSVISFPALEHVPLHAMRGRIDTTLIQLETKWFITWTQQSFHTALWELYAQMPWWTHAHMSFFVHSRSVTLHDDRVGGL